MKHPTLILLILVAALAAAQALLPRQRCHGPACGLPSMVPEIPVNVEGNARSTITQ